MVGVWGETLLWGHAQSPYPLHVVLEFFIPNWKIPWSNCL